MRFMNSTVPDAASGAHHPSAFPERQCMRGLPPREDDLAPLAQPDGGNAASTMGLSALRHGSAFASWRLASIIEGHWLSLTTGTVAAPATLALDRNQGVRRCFP
jgi:hypothetical protein